MFFPPPPRHTCSPVLAIAWIVLLSVLAAGEDVPKGVEQDIVAPGSKTVLMRAVVVAPKTLPKERRLGLAVLFHGMNGDARFMFGFTAYGTTANKLSDEWIWLGLKSKGNGWADEDHPGILAAINWAIANLPIDTRRVYGYGISHGAMRLARFAPEHPELFAGCVLMAGNGHALPSKKTMCGDEAAQRFYIIHGDADTIVPVGPDRNYVENLRKAQYPTVYREVAGDPHVLSYLPHQVITPDAIAWLEAQRNRAIPLEPKDQQALQRLAKAIEEGKREAAADFPLLERLAGAEVEAVVASAAAAKVPALRQAIARCASRRLYGGKAAKAILTLIDDPDATVRKDGIVAAGLLALWQDKDAVTVLIERATDTKRASDVRLACVAQLARIWRINLPCSNQEKTIGEALTKLTADSGSLGKAARQGLDGLVRWVDGAPTIVPPWKPEAKK